MDRKIIYNYQQQGNANFQQPGINYPIYISNPSMYSYLTQSVPANLSNFNEKTNFNERTAEKQNPSVVNSRPYSRLATPKKDQHISSMTPPRKNHLNETSNSKIKRKFKKTFFLNKNMLFFIV